MLVRNLIEKRENLLSLFLKSGASLAGSSRLSVWECLSLFFSLYLSPAVMQVGCFLDIVWAFGSETQLITSTPHQTVTLGYSCSAVFGSEHWLGRCWLSCRETSGDLTCVGHSSDGLGAPQIACVGTLCCINWGSSVSCLSCSLTW